MNEPKPKVGDFVYYSRLNIYALVLNAKVEGIQNDEYYYHLFWNDMSYSYSGTWFVEKECELVK